MPKNKYQKRQPLDNSSVDQFEIDTADSNFNLFFDDKKIKEKTRIQISILKDFFESYKSSSGYECKDAIDTAAFGDKLSAKYLKKLFDLSCQYDSEVQALVKIDQQDLISVVLLSKLQSLISNLDDKKNYDLTCRKIFAIMNRLLPYYPITIRDYFDLEGLFYSLEKMRIIFFKNLNGILFEKPKSNSFKQMQISYLCSMLLWVSHSKSKNFNLFIDALSVLTEVLSAEDLINFMFNAYLLTDDEIISILPCPLRMADILIKYYPDKILNDIKTSFLEFQKQNSLQMSLRREFIVFMDRTLDFALATTTLNRMFIFECYNKHLSLIDNIFLMYIYKLGIYDPDKNPNLLEEEIEKILLENPKEPIALICKKILLMRNKWQACDRANRQAYAQSAREAIKLAEQEKIEIDTRKVLSTQSIQQPSKQTIQAAQQFAERKLKQAKQEEEALAIKKNQAAKLVPHSFIDQFQNELTKKFSTIPNEKYREQENLFNSKEQILTKEIAEYMGLTSIEKLLDKALLKELETCSFSLKNEIREDELHTLLLLYINLLDIFLNRISNKMQIYKEQYVPLITKMFNRHGQKNFSHADHILNRQIKQDSTLILDNLTVTNDYCECILIIFDIINLLKLQLKDNEFYKIWNLPINFRKDEYKDNYNNASANLTQFRSYLEHKRKACKNLGRTLNKNKKNDPEINEKEISEKLEKLLDAISKIDSRINENDLLKQNFPKILLSKEAQVREQQIQNTVFDKEKGRIPIPYNRNEVRRSQSVADLRFFTYESQSNTGKEKNLSSNISHRRMSI